MKIKIKIEKNENLYKVEILNRIRLKVKIGSKCLIFSSHLIGYWFKNNVIILKYAYFDKNNLILFLKYIKLFNEKGVEIGQNELARYRDLNIQKHNFLFKFN